MMLAWGRATLVSLTNSPWGDVQFPHRTFLSPVPRPLVARALCLSLHLPAKAGPLDTLTEAEAEFQALHLDRINPKPPFTIGDDTGKLLRRSW